MSYIFKKNKLNKEWTMEHHIKRPSKELVASKYENCVYRFLNKCNEVIYVGKAKDLENRLYGHNHLPKECYAETIYIEYIKFNTEYDIDFAERYFISKYKPKYNIALHEKVLTFNVNELDNKQWIEFNEKKHFKLSKLNPKFKGENKIFSERDINIINFVRNTKICTTEQIQNVLFQGVVPRVCYRRLQSLIDSNLIKRKYFRINNKNIYIYYASKLPSKKNMKHDLLITEIAVQLINHNFEIIKYNGEETLYSHINRFIKSEYKSYKDIPRCLDYNLLNKLESFVFKFNTNCQSLS